MDRRQFIKGVGVASGVLMAAGSSAWLLIDGVNEQDLTVEAALKKLKQLEVDQLSYTGKWNLSQIFIHCAQSVEFSMTRFPVHKPEVFKSTVGKLAFEVFSTKGRMTHGLSEVIPGAPALDASANVQESFERFKNSLIEFSNYKGSLAPHFAYGELNKREYEKAHIMHFYDHMQEVTV